MAPPVSTPTRTSSVARSLAQAAAALRAQEWRDANSDAPFDSHGAMRQAPRYTREQPDEEQENAQYDRQAFYEELRARHRNLTQRQRLAREVYGPQTPWREPQWPRRATYREDAVVPATDESDRMQEPTKRQRVVCDDQPPMGRRPVVGQYTYRSAAYTPPPPPAQLVPRVSNAAAVERTFSGSVDRDEETERRSMVDGQRMTRMRPSPRSVQRPAAVAPVQVPDTRILKPQTRNKSPASSAGTPRDGGRTTEEVATVPSVVEEDPEDEPDSEAAVVEDDTPADQKKQKKRVRYLRDTDRRNIIKRIENGEKQASLAREFGVTRAAICHIKKNRFEILSRYNMLVKSAQEMDIAENFAGPPGAEMMVHEVRASSVLLLMTMLRDSRSNGVTFRRVAGRLIMILLEEALAILGTESVEIVTGTGHLYRGLERRHQFCGVAIGAEGFPFLVLFHQMEPDAPQGSIHVEIATDRRGTRGWRLGRMDVPGNIVQHKVLLFSATCSTGDAECKAIESLCSVGCDERSITLVVILAASDGVVNIGNRFPQVKIITGGIDGKVDSQTNTIFPGFGDFVSRYNSS